MSSQSIPALAEPAANGRAHLASQHEYLLQRGFPPQVIVEAGWRVEALGEKRTRYGLPPEAVDAVVWVIPYRHPNGRVAFERIRVISDADQARFGGGKYRQPAGSRLALYDPFDAFAVPVDSVLLIEGEANAVAAHVMMPSHPVIGLPGQGVFSSQMAAELAHVPVVFVWIDHHDKGWQRNAAKIGRLLREAGADDVRLLPDSAGLDANDALRELGAKRGANTLQAMFDRAAPIDAATDWPDIDGASVPPFPLDALPPDLAAFANAVAVETQTPPDLAALAMLNVLSAAALGSAVVDCGNWVEELGLHTLVVLPSGDRKSSVLGLVLAPLRQLEHEWCDEAREEVREKKTRLETLQARKQNLVRKVSQLDDAAERIVTEDELAETASEIDRIGEPIMPRLLADDATPEALAGLLTRHPRISILAAEAPLIDNLIGRYDATGSANLHLVCKAYTGEETRVDRRGRDAELLERPLLSIFLSVQEHVLRALVQHQIARAQGFVARFAFSLPESQMGRRDTNPPPVGPALHDAWAKIVRNVYSSGALTQPTQGGSVGSVSDPELRIPRLLLSSSARSSLNALRDGLEPRLADGEDLAPFRDWIARHHGRVARHAGVLHLAQHSIDSPITAETMQRALRIGEYLLAHALAALSAPDEQTRRALKWLARQGEPTVSQRDLHRGPLNSRGTTERAGQLVQALIELGALRPIENDTPSPPPPPTGGRPPSPRYEVNPKLWRAR